MDGIQMEPVGKYKADRNGSAKAAWRNMVDQDLDDVAFLADSDKARSVREAPVAVCSQRRALCLAALVFSAMFATALLVVYASPQPDCPCATESSLVPGQSAADADSNAANANKERIATNGAVFPWRGARLPTFIIPKHYSLWLHPNLTTGELKGEVSIDFKVDRDTTFVVLNVRDLNVTERALFKSGGSLGPKVAKVLDYPQADQTYIEFKDKLRRKYNYTLSLRFITKLDRSDKQRGFFLAGTHKNRCAVSRFWLTHARSAFPCLDEPHFRATFRLTIVRDRFHVSLTNMPIVATEEAGFYLGHRLLQDEFSQSPPMAPHMMSIAVCRLQRRAAPPLPLPPTEPVPTGPGTLVPLPTGTHPTTTGVYNTGTNIPEEEDFNLPPPEISLYSDQQVILDESGPLLDWVQRTIQLFAFELNTSYPLPKLDIVVVEDSAPYCEGWGLLTLSPAVLHDTAVLARLLAQQWFGGLVSPRWWSSQWLLEALTSVLGEKAPPLGQAATERQDALLMDHILPALRLDSSNSVRAVASPRLERADIESAADELSLHKGAAIVSMAIEAAGAEAGRAALARLLKDHRAASADARDLWRALQRDGAGSGEAPSHAWDGWCEKAGYPLLYAIPQGPDVVLRQERFVMTADPPEAEPPIQSHLLTLDLRADLEELFYDPENYTEIEDLNATSTLPPTTTTTRRTKTAKPAPQPKWVIPVTLCVGPLLTQYLQHYDGNITVGLNVAPTANSTWYDISNDTTHASRWTENVTHLIWMNDTEMTIPDLGKHKWVRYNVGARGLYRVAPQETAGEEWSTPVWSTSGAAERALLLDDAFVLARARRLPAHRAIAAVASLATEQHWSPWLVVVSHLSWWKTLLKTSASGPSLAALLKTLHPTPIVVYGKHNDSGKTGDHVRLSAALLTAGVEWENDNVTQQALKLFHKWMDYNATIPDIYQEAAFTSGIRLGGYRAWQLVWSALLNSISAPRPIYNHDAILHALASPTDDWLFYRFAYTVMSAESQKNREWKHWLTALLAATCRWRGAWAVWRVMGTMTSPPPPAALHAAAKCLHQPADYYRFKELFGSIRGATAALDTIALNSAFVAVADPDLQRYFNGINGNSP